MVNPIISLVTPFLNTHVTQFAPQSIIGLIKMADKNHK